MQKTSCATVSRSFTLSNSVSLLESRRLLQKLPTVKINTTDYEVLQAGCISTLMERYLKNLTLPGAFCNTTSICHALSQPTDDYGLLYLLTVLLLEAEKERGEARPPIKTNHRRGSAINQKPGCSFHIWHLPGSAQETELPRGCSPATRHRCGSQVPPAHTDPLLPHQEETQHQPCAQDVGLVGFPFLYPSIYFHKLAGT